MGQLEGLIGRCETSIFEEMEEMAPLRTLQRERRDIMQTYALAYASQCEKLTEVDIYLPGPAHPVRAETIEDIRCHLTALKEKRDHELKVAEANAGITNVSSTSSSTATASSMSVSFAQTIEAVDGFPESELSEEDKDALLGMLSRLEAADAKNDPSAKDKVAEIIRWLGDKSVDVITAVAPVVMKSLLGLQ